MIDTTSIAAVIVAAGRGLRAGGGLPKQWRMLGARTVAAHAIAAFREHPRVGLVALVLNPDDMAMAAGWKAHPDMIVVPGGPTRSHSVRAGLDGLAGRGVEKVLIHDVARPLVGAGVIDRVIDALAEAPGAAPALPVVDALWVGTGAGYVGGTRDRQALWRAQTPQGFAYAAIHAAHLAAVPGAADDVAVARAAGLDVRIVEGDERNFKITGPGDFARAENLLEDRMDIRIGNGFDVHAFGTGDHVMLCGVKVPHDRGLIGHSDADVGMHAATDAILGALADGDIGRHFPPSDPRWKSAASSIFLSHAARRAADSGFAVSNLDLTLICERPKIGPYAGRMIGELAAILGISRDRVSVKATTSERLGFTGREEGIAAMATAALVKA